MESKQIENTKIIKENEEESNSFVALIMIFLSLFTILILILSNIGLTNDDFTTSIVTLFFITAFNTFTGLIQITFPGKIKGMKYILMIIFIISVTVAEFFFSYYAILIFFAPTIVSTRYYSKKLTITIILITIASIVLTAVIGYLLAINNIFVSQMSSHLINWHDPIDVFVGNVFLKTIIYLIPTTIAYEILNNGIKMIDSKVKYTTDMNKIHLELQTASNIQKQVLPTDFDLYTNKGYELNALMQPAKDFGGDFYDFFVVDNRLFFLVGDVSDKGLDSAMVMMNVKNIIHSIALTINDPAEILTLANKLIAKDNKYNMFVTIWMGVMNSNGIGYFVNAGHNYPLIKKLNGDIEFIENEPEPSVGLFPKYKYKKHDLSLKDCSSILLYTDGATDIINEQDKSFGETNLLNCFKETDNDAKSIINSIYNKLIEYQGNKNQFDDITLLAITNFNFDFDKSFKCEMDNIEVIIDNLNKDLEKHSCSADTINLIDAAIDDALNNIISYAYEDPKNSLFHFQYIIKNDNLKIVISDNGFEFDIKKAKKPKLTYDRPIGGLGIHLIKNIMDNVNYIRSEKENILILEKKLNK